MSTPIYTTYNPNSKTANVLISVGKSSVYSNITIAGSGGSGGGGMSYSFNNPTWTATATDIKPNSINVNGDAVFNGNIEWKGRDMREWFNSVESRLNILQPNPKLEKEWEELAELRMKYVELERKLLEKQQVFDILKKT